MEPTSTAELFKIKDGMKALDVFLVVQVVREPVNIFSSNTGKSYRLLDIHASTPRGDVVKVSLWVTTSIDCRLEFVKELHRKSLLRSSTLARSTATNVTAQIVLRQNAPLLRYVLAVKNRVMVTGMVGRLGSLDEITSDSLKDVELAKSTEMIKHGMLLPSSSQSLTTASSSSCSSTGDRIFAKDINEFDGGQRFGYVLGVVLDFFEFEGESFKGELLMEDEEAAALPVTLSQVATTESQSFVTDARVQIRGLLQFGPERVAEFTVP